MAEQALRCVIVSDFNVANFAAHLANDAQAPRLKCLDAPFGQAAQLLLDKRHAVWADEPDAAIVWTRPQSVVESMSHLLDAEAVEDSRLLEQVDRFADMVLGLRGRVRLTIVPTWVLPLHCSVSASQALRAGIGEHRALLRMNLRLAERLADEPGVIVLPAEAWMTARGAPNPKLWFMSRTPFSSATFQEAAVTVKAAIRGALGMARKLVVVDLDDTLWGGIVGEVGPGHLRLGGHDAVGEAFADFQAALRQLARRGVLLGIVSKNDEATALRVIREHPEMVLRLEDFAGWRINWRDKAQNVADLTVELNLGLESVVFIDDNPAERARVREALPEVLTPDWPADVTRYREALAALRCFDQPTLSEEDRQRARMMQADRARHAVRAQVGSLDDWLKTLDMTVRIEPLGPDNLARAIQLLNKTNQMNLRTRRLDEAALLDWSRRDGRRTWVLRVADRLGDLGLTGLVSIEREGPIAHLPDLLLSCRVMGRKLEHLMLALAIREAQRMGLQRVEARYLPTDKNGPCLTALRQCGLDHDQTAHVFSWPTNRPYPFPPHLRVQE